MKAKFDEISSNREIIVEKCIFSDEVRIDTHIRKKIVIKDCVFKKGIIFNRTYFVNGFSFINNDVCGCINFENCAFEGGKYKIFHSKGEIYEINFTASVIKGLLELNSLRSGIFLSEDSSIKLNNIFVEPNGYLIIRNINEKHKFTGIINFTDANLLGNVVLKNIYLKRFLYWTNAVMVGGFFQNILYFKEESDSQTYVPIER